MNKPYFSIFFLLISLNVHSLIPYKATYGLIASTDLGSIKVGEAEFLLELNENDEYFFSSKAFTDSIWKTLYDYSRYEKSTGIIIENKLSGRYYDLVEIEKNKLVKNNKILINQSNGFAIFNNDSRWESNSKNILDELSVYLELSSDLQKMPEKNEFNYQVIDEKGIKLVTFISQGKENITVENTEIKSIKFYSPELDLLVNVSKEYNYIPLVINRSISKNRFRLSLKEFTALPLL
jgi:hypothetical protein|tara:strand:+ start:23 stop:730 length:708 start_codon:yes stop_codon:yes gene_type:complete